MRQTVRIGRLTLDGTPRVVAVVDRVLPTQRCAALASEGADLVEVRADLFAGPIDRLAAFADRLRKDSGLPMICTVRETLKNRATRLGIFERLLPLADAVDIEVDTAIRDRVIAMAAGRPVIVSYHDFRSMPTGRRLDRIVECAADAGADIVKIAGTANCADDVVRLMAFCRSCRHPMVAIAMGRFGMVSRIIAPMFGSLFSYAYLHRAVAPGQMPLGQLVAEFRRFYAGWKRVSRKYS